MALPSVPGRSRLNYLSLCTGGGGLDLGFGLACRDARAVCHMERDAFAAAHLVAAIGGGAFAEWAGVGAQPPRPGDVAAWRAIIEDHPHLAPALSRADGARYAGLPAADEMGAARGAPATQSGVRRMADGLAARLDTHRIDRLRMLGNGVHPLAAAYAISTLGARLSARGIAGADEFFVSDVE